MYEVRTSEMSTEFLLGNLSRRYILEALVVDGRMILQGMRVLKYTIQANY
jgi:hypothetical protein